MDEFKLGDKVYFNDVIGEDLFQNTWVITSLAGSVATCAIHSDDFGWQSLVIDLSLLTKENRN